MIEKHFAHCGIPIHFYVLEKYLPPIYISAICLCKQLKRVSLGGQVTSSKVHVLTYKYFDFQDGDHI